MMPTSGFWVSGAPFSKRPGNPVAQGGLAARAGRGVRIRQKVGKLSVAEVLVGLATHTTFFQSWRGKSTI